MKAIMKIIDKIKCIYLAISFVALAIVGDETPLWMIGAVVGNMFLAAMIVREKQIKF